MRKNSMKVGIIAAILVLAVGFAAITTTLVITGTIKIAPDKENFQKNIKFYSATLTYKDGTTGTVTKEDGDKKLVFTTKTFKDVEDTATLTFTISNNSQYGAIIPNLVCTVKTDNDNMDTNYVTITPANGLSGKTLNKGKISVADTVTIKLVSSYAGASGVGNSDPEEKEVVYECDYQDNIQATETVATGTDTIDDVPIPTPTGTGSGTGA